MTLELSNVSESEALEVLLRTVSGYVAAPRAVAVAGNASRFDRILVMPAAAAAKQALSSAPLPPTFQAPMPQPVVDDDPDDAPAGARPPIFGSFPPPQVTNPQFNNGVPPGFQPPPGFVPPNGAIPPQTGTAVVGQQPPSPTQGTTNTFGAPTGPGAGGVAVPGMMVPAPQQQPGPGIIQPGQPPQPGRGRGGQD